MRVATRIALSSEERRKLDKWASSRSTPVRLRERARIVLMAAEGMANKEIAAALGIDANKVGRWRTRYAKEGPRAIEKERPRGTNHGGKDSRAQAALRARVLEATTQTVPADATHWSCRSMARHLGTTHSFVNLVWRSHGLKPHLIRTFKLSNDLNGPDRDAPAGVRQVLVGEVEGVAATLATAGGSPRQLLVTTCEHAIAKRLADSVDGATAIPLRESVAATG